MENGPQNQTPSEQAPRGRSDEFNKVMQMLSNLPTDKAMRELSNNRIGPAIRIVIETMAISKIDLVKSMRFIRIREKVKDREISLLQKGTPITDQVLQEWMEKNPDYVINL